MSDKKPRTINEQLQLLKARGMNFANEERARVCLSHISYFRLKYYWKDMVDTDSEDEDFLESARFEDVVRRYDFDQRLRLILCDAVVPENGVKGKLLALLNEFQDVPYARLGFTGDWRKEPLWR